MSSPPPGPALLGYHEATALVAAHAAELRRVPPPVEIVELAQAVGRILACPLAADRDQPPFARSTRDGFACRAAEASTHKPLAVAGATRAGLAPAGPLLPGTAWEIMTGAPIPSGADAVVMLEHVQAADGRVRLLPPRTVEPGENIVARGAQARAADEMLPAGTAIHSAQIALAASCGHATLPVYARPRVAILTTGDELVPVASSPAGGQIRNSNGPMLAAMVAAAGGDPWVLPTAADTPQALDAALAQALEADLLLITGGVSAGKFDLVEPALARIGARFHFTGLRIQPGKPLVFGELPTSGATSVQNENGTKCIQPGKPLVFGELPTSGATSVQNENGTKCNENGTKCFFGLPGNPVSSAVTFLLFAAPILAALAGSREPAPRFALAQMAPSPVDRGGKPGLTRFLPAFCTFSSLDGQLPQVAFVPWQGSGDLTALARSNCFLVVPEDAHSLPPGSIVRILLP